jgi:hypothetical protein
VNAGQYLRKKEGIFKDGVMGSGSKSIYGLVSEGRKLLIRRRAL